MWVLRFFLFISKGVLLLTAMTTILWLTAVVILGCVLFQRLSGKVGVPALLFFILLGMFFGTDGVVKIPFDNCELAQNVCSVALLFIMFYGGFGTNVRSARPVAAQAVLLSSVGTALTAGLVGVFCHFVLGVALWESFLIGAVISSTDAASVFSVLRSRHLNLKYHTASLLEVESGSNDPFSYMLTTIVLSVMHGGSSGGQFAAMLAAQIGYGVLFGVVLALAARWVLGRFRFSAGFDAVFAVAVALLSYVLPEMLGGNGYLSVYLTGMILGNSRIPNKSGLVHFFDAATALMQMVLFFLLAILEGCGYMSRIAFVLDRIFRKFGLSGKSFIPMLIGTGCGIPGVMASRTIENERDRRMTIMTTTFIPCGAKVPFIAMIAGAIFGGSAIVSTSAYFIGMAAIIMSGIMLKKTKMFSGDPAPFVMELPAYHVPTLGNVLRSTWERGWSFIKKAGTIITLSTIFVWFTTYFGVVDGQFRMLSEEEINFSILAAIGGAIKWIFAPLGWGNWQAVVASITGLVAKENIVGTLGILYGGGGSDVYTAIADAFNGVQGYSFLIFNLLCAPCFAAIGAIRREMNNAKWTWFAIGYQCGFAYVIALIVNQIGAMFMGNGNIFGLIVAILLIAAIVYMLFRKNKYDDNTLTVTAKKAKSKATK